MEPEIFAPTNDVIARRIGRISFGLVLIARALWLFHAASVDARGFNVIKEIFISWLAAFVLGAISRVTAGAIRWARDPDFLFTRSICVPMVGLALLLLSFHMLVLDAWWSKSAFNSWAWASLLVTGLAHLALAILIIVRGRALVAGRPAVKPGTIFLVTLGVSCVPFVLFVFPPVFVTVTGLPLLWLLRAMETMVARERAELAYAPRLPPRAVVI